MIKRLLSIALSLVLLVLVVPAEAGAAGQEPVEVILLEDGYCLEVATFSAETRATSIKGAGKTYTFKNSSGTALWKVELFGLFQYNGLSSECTESDCTVTIYDDAWFEHSNSAYCSGNTAYATVQMELREAFVVTRTETIHISVSCDEHGNIS